jgi:hypothetical protein
MCGDYLRSIRQDHWTLKEYQPGTLERTEQAIVTSSMFSTILTSFAAKRRRFRLFDGAGRVQSPRAAA